MTIQLPPGYEDLANEGAPRILVEMLKVYGTKEVRGPGDNPTIVQWAEDIGYKDFKDSTPWCGVGMGYVAKQAGYHPPVNPAWAQNWLEFGDEVTRNSAMLADILVFHRPSGGHVALYVGEDHEAYHIMGCNQSDAVSIERKAKTYLLGARRCHWQINQPSNIRKIYRVASGALASNDA